MCSPWTWRWCPPRREHRATPSHTSVTNPTFLHPYTIARHLDKHRDAAIVWPNSPVIANLVHQTIIQICEVVTVVHGKGRIGSLIALPPGNSSTAWKCPADLLWTCSGPRWRTGSGGGGGLLPVSWCQVCPCCRVLLSILHEPLLVQQSVLRRPFQLNNNN